MSTTCDVWPNDNYLVACSTISTGQLRPNGRWPTTLIRLSMCISTHGCWWMYRRLTPPQRSWVSTWPSLTHFRQRALRASQHQQVSSTSHGSRLDAVCPTHFPRWARAASKKLQQCQMARCGISCMSGKIAACRVSWCNEPKRLALKPSWSPSTLQFLAAANETCAVGSPCRPRSG